mmetsp:Transcript_835/g.1233  ORF Transcript_835/g.1233 Transcript_835/m.1233 type:complete len:106 (-) Transcript_835:157-474(-)
MIVDPASAQDAHDEDYAPQVTIEDPSECDSEAQRGQLWHGKESGETFNVTFECSAAECVDQTVTLSLKTDPVSVNTRQDGCDMVYLSHCMCTHGFLKLLMCVLNC